MATRAETSVVYAAGAAQGIVLVTFPTASTIFTSPHEYDLSNTQYGVLFLPQVATAITASLLGAWLVAISAAMAGGVIAFYQLGYGIAAFGTGPLRDGGVGLSSVYAAGAVIAAAMGLLSFAVTRRPVREADAQRERQSVAGPVERPP